MVKFVLLVRVVEMVIVVRVVSFDDMQHSENLSGKDDMARV